MGVMIVLASILIVLVCILIVLASILIVLVSILIQLPSACRSSTQPRSHSSLHSDTSSKQFDSSSMHSERFWCVISFILVPVQKREKSLSMQDYKTLASTIRIQARTVRMTVINMVNPYRNDKVVTTLSHDCHNAFFYYLVTTLYFETVGTC